MLPYVGLFLAIMIILFSAALLIFCKNKRASKDKGTHAHTQTENLVLKGTEKHKMHYLSTSEMSVCGRKKNVFKSGNE